MRAKINLTPQNSKPAMDNLSKNDHEAPKLTKVELLVPLTMMALWKNA